MLVLGVGNPSRTDDGAGHYVVQHVEKRMCEFHTSGGDSAISLGHQTVDTECVHQLVPELADTIKDYDVVVFVDARVGRSTDDVDLSSVAPAYGHVAVSHYWTVGSLLALTAELYGNVPPTFVLSVAGHDFGFGFGLSPEAQAEADTAVERLAEFLGIPYVVA